MSGSGSRRDNGSPSSVCVERETVIASVRTPKEGSMRSRYWIVILFGFFSSNACFASQWSHVELPARVMNITENDGVFWVCGANELIASSADGGKSWTAKRSEKNGDTLLRIGFANQDFGYAAGTGGRIFLTKDSGNTWNPIKAPAQVVYDAAFSDEKHGLIHTPRSVYTTNDGGASWNEVQIDLASDDLKGFSYVLGIAAPSANDMAIVLSEGDSSANDYRLFLTKDGGLKWAVSTIPSTGLGRLTAHGGEYWFAGMEVIERDKPGGGYGVPLVMHSPDGDHWTHLDRWSKHEFSECNSQGCLYWDGAGVQVPPTNPMRFWTFAPEKVVAAKWAVAKNTICTVGTGLSCSAVTDVQTMPPYVETSSPIAPPLAAPPLDSPPSQGLQCIYCDFERIMVTKDFQGPAEVQLKLQIGLTGLVDDVEVIQTSNSGIGDRVASSARSWIFVPLMKDGVPHPVVTQVKLRVQALKNK